MKQKQIIKKNPPALIGLVRELLEDHIKLSNAIVADYVGGPEMEYELETANERLLEKLSEVADDHESFDFLLSEMEKLDRDEIDYDKLIELAKDQDFDPEKLLALVDDSDIYSWLSEKGEICVNVSNMNLRSKLEDFIKTEIYPNLRDQESFVVL